MNDTCEYCEKDDNPVWWHEWPNGDTVRLCDDCLAILQHDGAVEL